MIFSAASLKIFMLTFLMIAWCAISCYGQETFTGEIRRTRYYTFHDYDAVKASVKVSPYDTISITNYVCSDTLIAIVTRNDNNLTTKTVDIGKYRYIYDQERSYYLKIFIPTGRIESIPIRKWKKIREENSDFLLTAPHPRLKDRIIKLKYDPNLQYINQANLGGEFSEIFFPSGALTKVSVVNNKYNYENVITNKFTVQEQNCKDHIGNFIIKDVSEDTWVKNYFQEVDTSFIPSSERSKFTEDYSELIPANDISADFTNVFRNKVVYLDFWASWCAPCRKEAPYLQSIKELYSENDLSIVSISLDKLEGFEKWTNAMNTLNMNWFNYLLKGGFESYLVNQFEVQNIPWYMLIDKKGKIATYHAPRPSDPRSEVLIEKLLTEN